MTKINIYKNANMRDIGKVNLFQTFPSLLCIRLFTHTPTVFDVQMPEKSSTCNWIKSVIDELECECACVVSLTLLYYCK